MDLDNTTRLSKHNADIALMMKFIEEGNVAEFTRLIESKDGNQQKRDFSEEKWRDLLTMAIDYKSSVCAKLLIENGANIHAIFDGPFHFGENLLGFAIEVGAFDIARLLLEHGAKPIEANNNHHLAKYSVKGESLSLNDFHQLIENIRNGIDPISR